MSMPEDKQIIEIADHLCEYMREHHKLNCQSDKHEYEQWDGCNNCWNKFVTDLYKAGHRHGFGENKCSRHGWQNTNCPSCIKELEKELDGYKQGSKAEAQRGDELNDECKRLYKEVEKLADDLEARCIVYERDIEIHSKNKSDVKLQYAVRIWKEELRHNRKITKKLRELVEEK